MKQRWILCVRCLTPMQHNSGSVRNRSIVNRQTFAGDQRQNRIPILSANSLRHNCLREPLGLDLIRRYGMADQLDKPHLRLLVSGGNNASEKGGRIDLDAEQRLRAAIPMLSLLGCGLPSGPIDSRLTFGDAVLVCRESLPMLRSIAPELDLPEKAWSAVRLVADADHFAPDPSRHLGFALNEEARKQDFDDNIFAGEYVIPGSVFVAELTGIRLGEVELSALSYGLSLWSQSGGVLGGKSAHGRGRTECMVWGDLPSEECYVKTADQSQDEAKRWLTELFQGFKPKAKKEKDSQSKSRQKSLMD